MDKRLWIDRIFAANPSMEAVYPGESRYVLEPFCVRRGQVEYFDLGQTPIRRLSFALGEAEVRAAGFVITEACIGCGSCRDVCPQQCITEGAVFAIVEEHCLHCGLCAENCPTEAIVRREMGYA